MSVVIREHINKSGISTTITTVKYDSIHYIRILKKNHIRLIVVTENLDDSPEAIILESVLEGMAAYYRL